MSAESQQASFASDWVEALAKMPSIPKTRKAEIPTKSGSTYSYQYADLPDVRDTVVPILAEHHMAQAQDVVDVEGRPGVITRIYHRSGHVETFGPLVLAGSADPRSVGSSITYARRYALCAALGIVADDDDDGARAAEPSREDFQAPVSKWLGDAVQMFKDWTHEQRQEQYLNAVKQLALEEVADLDTAKQVIEFMHGIYIEEHPDEAPF